MNKVKYLDALAGSGKTHWAIGEINRVVNQLSHNVAYVAPTKDLQNQVLTDPLSRYPNTNAHLINSDTHDSAIKSITDDYSNDLLEPRCLIITHQAFDIVRSRWTNKQNWQVIYDEVPDPVSNIALNVSESVNANSPYQLIKMDELFDFVESDLPGYYEVLPRYNDQIERIAYNQFGDTIYGALQDFCRIVSSPDHTAHAQKASVNRILNGEISREFCKIIAGGLLTRELFEGFDNATITGALFDTTPYYHHTKDMVD